MILELQIYEQQYESIKIDNEDDVARYYKLKKKLELVQDQMAVMVNEPKYILPFLQPGRLVTVGSHRITIYHSISEHCSQVKSGDLNFDWCVVLNFHRKPGEKVRLSHCLLFNTLVYSLFISSMFSRI